MRLERSKNLVHNLKWGVLYRLSGMLIPFVCKATIIRNFGVNYLGLSSLFASIISTLNLAELGFGSAVVFFMYKEIAEENAEKICALLKKYDIPAKDQVTKLWDILSDENPCELVPAEVNEETVFDLPQLLEDAGIYLAGRREE